MIIILHQENGWDLPRALNIFFASKCEKAETSSTQATPMTGPTVQEAITTGMLSTQAPSSLVMVTWNIDGLDQHNLKRRTRAVVKTLQEKAVDIVFLQEVIPETFSYLESKLPNYDCFAAKQENYFVATLLRRGRVYMDKTKVRLMVLVLQDIIFVSRLWIFLGVGCTDTCWQCRPTAAVSRWTCSTPTWSPLQSTLKKGRNSLSSVLG